MSSATSSSNPSRKPDVILKAAIVHVAEEGDGVTRRQPRVYPSIKAVSTSPIFGTAERRPFRVEASERDLRRAEVAQARRHDHHQPLVGDFVRFHDNSMRRLSVSYGDRKWQVSYQENTCAFFLCDDGRSDCSAGSHSFFFVSGVEPTNQRRKADFWMWHDGQSGAYRGTGVAIDVRVWLCADATVLPDTADRQRRVTVDTPCPAQCFRPTG